VYDTFELMNTLQQNPICISLLLIKVTMSWSIFHDRVLSQVHKFTYMMPNVSWQVAELPWSGCDVWPYFFFKFGSDACFEKLRNINLNRRRGPWMVFKLPEGLGLIEFAW